MQTTPPSNTPDSESPLTGDALLELLQSLKEQNRLQQRTLDEQAEIIGKKSDVIGAQKKQSCYHTNGVLQTLEKQREQLSRPIPLAIKLPDKRPWITHRHYQRSG